MSYICPRCHSTYLFRPEICPGCTAQDHHKQKQRRAQERRGSYDPHGKVNEAEFWQLLRLYPVCPCCNTAWAQTNGVARDHIIPLSRGGLNILANLQPICNRCNLWKSAAIIYFDRKNPGVAAALPERLWGLLRPETLTDIQVEPVQLGFLEPPTQRLRYPEASPVELEAETLRLTRALILERNQDRA